MNFKNIRLYHVSEEADIKLFIPRIPDRNDIDKEVGLVWAIDEKHLPNFLTPRDCPRVCYCVGKNTTRADVQSFFSSNEITHTVLIEQAWMEKFCATVLYIYEFNTDDFELQDEVAGYYVAKTTQIPIAKHKIDDLMCEIKKRNVELRTVENLWEAADRIKSSSMDWSLCRMRNAAPRK